VADLADAGLFGERGSPGFARSPTGAPRRTASSPHATDRIKDKD
jgi:hypothetical protein